MAPFWQEENAMPEIRENSEIVTQITTVKVPPSNQTEVLQLMTERARFMATQPGFVSVSLHRSEDGSHVINYVQWKNRKQLEAAHHSPQFRAKWPRFGELIQEAEPCLYRVTHVEAA
jgi:heme-degrading monooxygenase HmoA